MNNVPSQFICRSFKWLFERKKSSIQRNLKKKMNFERALFEESTWSQNYWFVSSVLWEWTSARFVKNYRSLKSGFRFFSQTFETKWNIFQASQNHFLSLSNVRTNEVQHKFNIKLYQVKVQNFFNKSQISFFFFQLGAIQKNASQNGGGGGVDYNAECYCRGSNNTTPKQILSIKFITILVVLTWWNSRPMPR